MGVEEREYGRNAMLLWYNFLNCNKQYIIIEITQRDIITNGKNLHLHVKANAPKANKKC